MSLYPAPVAAQDLYESSATQKIPLGTESVFPAADGTPVWARYMKNVNAASVAAGMIVCHNLYQGNFNTLMASTHHPNQLAGGLAASCAVGGYAWVIFKGKQTNASMNSSHASAAGMFFFKPGAAGGMISFASSTAFPAYATADANLVAFAESAVSNTTGATGNIVWLWR